MVIEYVRENISGKVLVFVNNQSTLHMLLNVKLHLLYKLAHQNSCYLGDWLLFSPTNEIEFQWMPSHLGFVINELANKLADTMPVGLFPFPQMTIVSGLRHNKALAVHEWHAYWQPFAASKDLMLKKKKKKLLPNAWDGKDKLVMHLAGDMVTFSRLT